MRVALVSTGAPEARRCRNHRFSEPLCRARWTPSYPPTPRSHPKRRRTTGVPTAPQPLLVPGLEASPVLHYMLVEADSGTEWTELAPAVHEKSGRVIRCEAVACFRGGGFGAVAGWRVQSAKGVP